MEDICDAGLVLALGYEKKSPTADVGVHRTKLDTSSLHSSDSLEPSLTLGRQSSSPHSTLSSHSNVKRERDVDVDVGGEEVDRLSSRTNDDDEDGSGNRKKLRLTKEQSALLEERFKEHSTLNPKQKAALAKQLNLRPRQVEVWFQNRRARTKLKQTEVDCELLKKYCDMLTEENRRLQMEVQELKALDLAPTFYVQQRPAAGAATVTICASCRRIGKAHDSPNAAARHT